MKLQGRHVRASRPRFRAVRRVARMLVRGAVFGGVAAVLAVPLSPLPAHSATDPGCMHRQASFWDTACVNVNAVDFLGGDR